MEMCQPIQRKYIFKNYPRKLILQVFPKSFHQSDFDDFCLFMSKIHQKILTVSKY